MSYFHYNPIYNTSTIETVVHRRPSITRTVLVKEPIHTIVHRRPSITRTVHVEEPLYTTIVHRRPSLTKTVHVEYPRTQMIKLDEPIKETVVTEEIIEEPVEEIIEEPVEEVIEEVVEEVIEKPKEEVVHHEQITETIVHRRPSITKHVHYTQPMVETIVHRRPSLTRTVHSNVWGSHAVHHHTALPLQTSYVRSGLWGNSILY